MSGPAALWGGASYERIAATFSPIHERVVRELALRRGESLLDLACGTGGVGLLAARAGADVVGLDISPDQLEKARRTAAQEGLEIRFDEGDCQELPYEDASFAAVASVFGLIFAPSHARAAAEVARICRPSGRLAFTAWYRDGWSRTGERLGREPRPGDAEWRLADPGYVRRLFGEAFDLRFEDGLWEVEAESAEAIWELVSSSAPPLRAWLDSLDPDRREEARQAYLELFAGGRLRREYVLVLGTRR